MVSNSVNCLFNALKISKQKKCSIINVGLSNNSTNILFILLKEGLIRGYFFGWCKHKRVIYVLLKYIDYKNKCVFDKVFVCFSKEYFFKKYLLRISNGFCFFIISTQIGFISNYNLLLPLYKTI